MPGEQESTDAEESINPYGLSAREIEVLMNVWKGLSDKEIAQRMGISHFTASKHLGAVMRKMDVGSRTQASLRVEREPGFQRFLDDDANSSSKSRRVS